jgi:hypothetical protein
MVKKDYGLPKSDEGLSGEYGTNFIGCRVYGGV